MKEVAWLNGEGLSPLETKSNTSVLLDLRSNDSSVVFPGKKLRMLDLQARSEDMEYWIFGVLPNAYNTTILRLNKEGNVIVYDTQSTAPKSFEITGEHRFGTLVPPQEGKLRVNQDQEFSVMLPIASGMQVMPIPMHVHKILEINTAAPINGRAPETPKITLRFA